MTEPPPERILFVELWRLGDAVCATAGLRALRAARPKAEIAVLAHPANGDPLFRSPEADVCIPFDAFWTHGKLWRHKYLPWRIGYRSIARARKAIRQFDAHTQLLFRGDVREQWFLWSAGARGLVDFESALPSPPGARRIPWLRGVPRYQEYVHLIRTWSGQQVTALPRIADVVPAARAGERYVVVNPGGSWRYKQWSALNFAALIRRLHDEGRVVLVVGAPSDAPFIERIRSLMAPGIAEVTFPSLGQLYTITAGAAAVISNNSAAFHIAEALGVPAIVLTGPSDPVRWGTYREHSRTIARSVGLPCHPCKEKRCVRPRSPCMDMIQLDDVLAALARTGIIMTPPRTVET